MSADYNINFHELQSKFNRMMEDLPAKVGTIMVNFSKQRFRDQNWLDAAPSPWAKRKAGAKRNKGRALLVDSGRLRRSIRLINVTRNRVTIGTDVPYAEAHNEGVDKQVTVNAFSRRKTERQKIYSVKTRKGRFSRVEVGSGNVKTHTRHMMLPRRRFLGPSAELTNQLTRFIQTEINKVFSTSP